MATYIIRRLLMAVITLWLVSSLSCGLSLSGPAPTAVPPAATRPQPTEIHSIPQAVPTPTQVPTATEEAAAATESPTLTAAPTRPSQPVVAASYCILADCSQYTYPGDWLHGVYGGSEGVMLVLPGQIWIAADFTGIQQWDPQTGKLGKTIPNTVETDFTDIKFDGTQVWVYALVIPTASSSAIETGVLYVIDPVQGKLVKKIAVDNDKKQDIENDAIDFPNIGVSPGKIWVKDRLIDTQTFVTDIMPWNFIFGNAHFAYDGQGMMWVQGDACPDCAHSI